MKQALKLVGVAALGFALLLSSGCGGGDKKAAAPAPAMSLPKLRRSTFVMSTPPDFDAGRPLLVLLWPPAILVYLTASFRGS